MDQPTMDYNSPLADLSTGRFGGHTYQNEQVLTVSNVALTRIPNNPNRVFWLAMTEGANDVRVSNRPEISGTSGYKMVANGVLISMFWENDGEAVGYEIYMIAVGAPSTVRYREVIRT